MADQEYLEILYDLKTKHLTIPDADCQRFSIYTDANSTGCGATILDDQDRPVFFMSRKLPAGAERWSIYEKELLCVELSLKAGKFLIIGREINLYVDCKAVYESLVSGKLPESEVFGTAAECKNVRRLNRISSFPASFRYALIKSCENGGGANY